MLTNLVGISVSSLRLSASLNPLCLNMNRRMFFKCSTLLQCLMTSLHPINNYDIHVIDRDFIGGIPAGPAPQLALLNSKQRS